jgi:hypothetical protein
VFPWPRTCSVTLPMSRLKSPVFPWLPMTIRPASCCPAASTIAWSALPRRTIPALLTPSWSATSTARFTFSSAVVISSSEAATDTMMMDQATDAEISLFRALPTAAIPAPANLLQQSSTLVGIFDFFQRQELLFRNFLTHRPALPLIPQGWVSEKSQAKPKRLRAQSTPCPP